MIVMNIDRTEYDIIHYHDVVHIKGTLSELFERHNLSIKSFEGIKDLTIFYTSGKYLCRSNLPYGEWLGISKIGEVRIFDDPSGFEVI
jgi:hypothetical protein